MQYRTGTSRTGYDYFILGWKLIKQPGITPYVILPILVNIIVMSLLGWWLFSEAAHLIQFSLHFIPHWLQWLSYFVYALIIAIMAFFFCYIFSTATNFLAAPFNGLLSEKVEARLTGDGIAEFCLWELIKDVPRVLKRECYKLLYYLLWAVPLFLLYWIPIIGQTLAPITWFVFTAWMVNIQYADYAFDNHKVSFSRMRQMLKQHKKDNLIFGVLVSVFTLLPIFNLIIMPIAVCGATAMWVDKYRNQLSW